MHLCIFYCRVFAAFCQHFNKASDDDDDDADNGVMCLRGEGASPNRRDYGRRLCAEEWARFCGRHSCADAIAKYIRSTKYFFTKTFLLAKDKWKSEPDLLQLASPAGSTSQHHKVARRDSGGWLQRHLSLKRKKQQQQVNLPSKQAMQTIWLLSI